MWYVCQTQWHASSCMVKYFLSCLMSTYRTIGVLGPKDNIDLAIKRIKPFNSGCHGYGLSAMPPLVPVLSDVFQVNTERHMVHSLVTTCQSHLHILKEEKHLIVGVNHTYPFSLSPLVASRHIFLGSVIMRSCVLPCVRSSKFFLFDP